MKLLNLQPLVANFFNLPRWLKRGIILSSDVGLCTLTVWFAYYLRLGHWVELSDVELRPIFSAIVAISILIPIFIISGMYQVIFRYSSFPALWLSIKTVLIYGFFYAVLFTVIGFQGVPRTIGLIQPLLMVVAIVASRAALSFILGVSRQSLHERYNLPKILIYGAGSAGRQLAKAIEQSDQMRVLGFLDDNASLQGSKLLGYTIYSPKDLSKLIKSLGISEVLLALPSVSHKRRIEVIEFIASCKVLVKTLPSLIDIAQGKVAISQIRDLDIADLLGRDIVAPDQMLLGKNIKNKVVMVTGAGGSIGSELCRQIIRNNPKKLILLEQGEFNLYHLHQELIDYAVSLDKVNIVILPILASVRDINRMREVVSQEKPHTIFHAAAYKHVPLVEANPVEGIRNNAFGTLIAAQVALENGVENFTLISTDKAVRPTNVMGASKRLAELVLQALAEYVSTNAVNSKTIFSMVRFGNVLNSSGSVVPRFRQQIQSGGPITLTHPDVTRYFMTIPEAAQLVIQASAMAKGGEVFLLDMGEPVRILDLATRMVELSGLKVLSEFEIDGDIEISITGLRPGEKLHEELLIADNPMATSHPKIMKAQESFLPWLRLQEQFSNLELACDVSDLIRIEALLKELVSGYAVDQHSST